MAKGSPFKFLDSYTREDREIFFGREREIEEMYQKVFEGRILLIYGISGTGKTSLINCGLANKFQESDWLPVSIRKGGNITDSLVNELKRIAITDISEGATVAEILQSIYLDHFKPVYLIFDQFEEVFVFGDQKERMDFIGTVNELLASDIRCKFIFSIREEYLAGLTEFEYHIPDFLSNRIRIERMTPQHAVEVIRGPCAVQGIEVEAGFPEAMLEKLDPEGRAVELTYLQVFIDSVYKLSGDTRKFTIAQLKKLGNVSNLLGSFLEEQVRELDDPETGLVVLKSFVSVEGTKKQVTEQEVLEFSRTVGREVDEKKLHDLLQLFVNLRILRDKDENGRYELRHDSLALEIFKKITLAEKELIEVRQFLEQAFKSFNKRGKLLGPEDLEYIAPHEHNLFLNQDTRDFIGQSKKEAVRAKKRRRQVAAFGSTILIILLTGLSIWALKARRDALTEKKNAQVNYYASLSREVLLENPTKALRIAQYVRSLDTANQEINNLVSRIYYDNVFYKTIIEIDGNITCTEIAPDEKSILIVYDFINVGLFDQSGRSLVEYTGHESAVIAVSFSPDGSMVLTGSVDMTARLWSKDGVELLVLKDHEQRVSCVEFAPDGKSFLTGSWDGKIRKWDLDGELINVFDGYIGAIEELNYSNDGRYIISSSTDRTIRLWDQYGNQLKVIDRLNAQISCIDFSPDGKTIAAVTSNEIIGLWDLEDGNIRTFSGTDQSITDIQFSPDGERIVTGSVDGSATIWSLEGVELLTLKSTAGAIRYITYQNKGKSILTSSSDGKILSWDLKGSEYKEYKNHNNAVSCVSYFNEGKWIASGSYDNTIIIWDLDGNLINTLTAHAGPIYDMDVSEDGKFLLTGGLDSTIRLWNNVGEELLKIESVANYVNSLALSPEGKRILSSNAEYNTAHLWDLDGKELQVFEGHLGDIRSVGFSADGSLILTGSDDETVRLWNTDGKKTDTIFEGDFGSFTPSGDMILTGSRGGIIRLYSLEGKELMSTYLGQDLFCMAISPNGTMIAVGLSDQTARIIDLKGRQLQILRGHSGSIYSVCFSKDGKELLTGSVDRTVRRWAIKDTFQDYLLESQLDELTIGDRLEYKFLEKDELLKSGDINQQYQGARYFSQKASETVDRSSRIDYLFDAHDLYNSIISKNEHIDLLTGLADIQIMLYESDSDTSKWKTGFENTHSRLIKNENKRDLTILLDYYYSKGYPIKTFLNLKIPDKIYQTCERLLLLFPEDSTLRRRIAGACSDLSYFMLQWKEYEISLQVVLLAQESDPTLGLIYTNLPLAYLFDNQFEKAKEIYLEWKDKEWEQVNDLLPDFGTFREVFLEDLRDLEIHRSTHPDFEKVRKLLEE